MFKNIGSKLKKSAKVIWWVGLILSFLSGIAILLHGGWLIILIGVLSTLITSWVLYGIGQIVENTDHLVAMYTPSPQPVAPAAPADETIPQDAEAEQQAVNSEVRHIPTTEWICYSCGNRNALTEKYCTSCYVSKAWSDKKHMGR